MKTREELDKMTILELHGLCRENVIVGYSRLSKMKLITIILDTQEAKQAGVKLALDRNNIPVKTGDEVKVRISGTNWVKGVVQKIRNFDSEDYFGVLVDGQDKSIMRQSIDIDSLDSYIRKEIMPSPEPEKISITKKPDASKPDLCFDGVSTEEITHYLEESGFRKTKYDHILAKIDRGGINKGDIVEFTVSSSSKKNPGAVMKEAVKSFVWDKQGGTAYFVISAWGKDYYKTISSVKKVYE